jgi:L-arabinokinase
MWRFETQPPFQLPDVEGFLAGLRAREDFFARDRPVIAARAPGRLDLMGGIADYSGSLVLEWPLACATWAAAQWAAVNDEAGEATVSVFSANAHDVRGAAHVEAPLAALLADYPAVRERLSRDPDQHWAAYVMGTVTVLHHERGIRFPHGIRIFVTSEVPAGKGVSSSAAIEVAAMSAVCGLLDLRLDGRDLALLSQKVENLVVGAPCGVMDQMTSACGLQGSLMALLCQPAELHPAVHLPDTLEVWGIDSRIRHAVTGADYGSVRVGAFMGYRIIGDLAGLAVTPNGDGRVMVDDPHWHGYLANISPALWETRFHEQVPPTLSGQAFLARYGGFTDQVTAIDPAATYAVRQPTAHPIYEHQRVQRFRAAWQKPGLGEADYRLLGGLMFQSHQSYSACGLGSDGTDQLVEMVRAAGPQFGLYGAKITGGGSGGTVAVLGHRGSEPRVRALAQSYAQQTGRAAHVLGGSSPGAVQFGVYRLVDHDY